MEPNNTFTEDFKSSRFAVIMYGEMPCAVVVKGLRETIDLIEKETGFSGCDWQPWNRDSWSDDGCGEPFQLSEDVSGDDRFSITRIMETGQ